MKIEVHFSMYLSKRNNDVWKFKTVDACTENEAKQKIIEEYSKDGQKVNYILSCTPM